MSWRPPRSLLILLLLVAVFLGGIGTKTAWDTSRHTLADHTQHHALILLMNELIRRDPTLLSVVAPAPPAPAAPSPPEAPPAGTPDPVP